MSTYKEEQKVQIKVEDTWYDAIIETKSGDKWIVQVPLGIKGKTAKKFKVPESKMREIEEEEDIQDLEEDEPTIELNSRITYNSKDGTQYGGTVIGESSDNNKWVIEFDNVMAGYKSRKMAIRKDNSNLILGSEKTIISPHKASLDIKAAEKAIADEILKKELAEKAIKKANEAIKKADDEKALKVAERAVKEAEKAAEKAERAEEKVSSMSEHTLASVMAKITGAAGEPSPTKGLESLLKRSSPTFPLPRIKFDLDLGCLKEKCGDGEVCDASTKKCKRGNSTGEYSVNIDGNVIVGSEKTLKRVLQLIDKEGEKINMPEVIPQPLARPETQQLTKAKAGIKEQFERCLATLALAK